MIKLLCAGGLGDVIYMRALAMHFLERGESVHVYTRWEEVFIDLNVTTAPVFPGRTLEGVRVMTDPFWPEPTNLGKNIFEVSCVVAGVTEPVELKINWTVQDPVLVEQVRHSARGRKILVFQPLKRLTYANQERATPSREAFNRYLANRYDCYRIKVGGHPDYVVADPETECDLDLSGPNSIVKAFDIATVADVFFGEANFLVSLAQATKKQFVLMVPHDKFVPPERSFDMTYGTVIFDNAEIK